MSDAYREVKLNGRSSCLFDKDKYCYKKARGKCIFACEEKSQECPSKIQAADGKILSQTGKHNHMPNIVGFQAKVVSSELYHAAVMTDDPINELVDEKLEGLSLEVLAELPDADRMKTSLQATRRAAKTKRNAGNTVAQEKAEKPDRKRKATREKENKLPKQQTSKGADKSNKSDKTTTPKNALQ
ncbi:Hypothetical predicted protein [Cloeon dipterum]|nr:Hypothetical predicted protein [Cloeon dipterum]